MINFEALNMSINAIIAHKLRSLLTMLGIIIGIASVVCVVALGNGSQQKCCKISTRSAPIQWIFITAPVSVIGREKYAEPYCQ